MKCNKCGAEGGTLIRVNPTGQPGIFHCTKCLDQPIDPALSGLLTSLSNKEDAENIRRKTLN